MTDFLVKFTNDHTCDFVMRDEFPEHATCRICGKSILEGIELPPPPVEKPLTFFKYDSIENVQNSKMLSNIVFNGFDKLTWVAVNKLHGANFAVHASAEKVEFARRTDFLTADENFYGYQKAKPALIDIARSLQSHYGKNVTVFMELFGGNYPHPEVKNREGMGTKVQDGVWYCPFNDIRCIDIAVDGKYIDYDELIIIAPMFGVKLAPEMRRGTFEQMLDLDPTFEDPIYKEYKLPRIEGNTSEGYVLRPVKECRLPNGKRVILKHKSPKFAEKKSVPKKPITMNVSETVQSALDELSQCITEERLNNILSHGEKFTAKDFGRLQGLFVQDILKEEDDNEVLVSLSKEDYKVMNKLLTREVANFIRPRFQNIIEE